MKSVIAAALVSLSCTANAATWFLPPNNFDKQDSLYESGGLNEAQFNQVIDQVEALYAPIVGQHGATLTVVRQWEDPTVNAFADQPSETSWEVHMFGGLARRPEVTQDGFAMVLCHELGHHLGGFPFVTSTDFAANEGQADMHATGPCASLVFAKTPQPTGASIPASAQARCDAAHSSARARQICYRAMAAAKSLADLLASLEGSKVSFDTPDTSVVAVTNNDHPAAQCRLDTYVASAICADSFWDYGLIPGKQFADRNSREAEQEAFAHSCVGGAGARPRCWFAP